MKYIKQYFIVCAVFSLMILSGCSDQWDDRTSMTDPKFSDKTLLQLIQEDQNLSEFYKILQTTSYAQALAATSKVNSGMSVFAPTNDVLADQNITASETDLAVLVALVRNHISLTSNISGTPGEQQRIKMANGKGLTFDSQAGKVDGIELVTSNKVCKNGVLHVIDGLLSPKLSIWEFMSEKSYLQTARLRDYMDYSRFDNSSQIIGYTPGGDAIYDSLFFELNTFKAKVPVDNEDSLYVYVVLTDDAYLAHHARYARVLRQIKEDERFNQSGTDSITNMHLNMDLMFRVPKVNGDYDLALHSVMKSVQGVNVYFNPSDIVSQQKLSNGMLYVVSACSIPMQNNKIKPIFIEGESCQQRNGDFPGDSTSQKVIRLRSWASNGRTLFAQGQNFIRFRPEVFAVPYKIYWRLGYDTSSDTLPMKQRLYLSNPGGYMVSPNNTNITPGLGTTTAGDHIRYSSVDPNYPDTAILRLNTNLNLQVTTYFFFGGIQDTIRDARWTIAASDTASRTGWKVGRYVAPYVYGGYSFPVQSVLNITGMVVSNGLSASQIARVRAGERIDVGWRAHPNYLQESQLFYTETDFPITSAGVVITTTKATGDLARWKMDRTRDTYKFLSYGSAGLAVKRDLYNRANNWAKACSYWSNAATPVLNQASDLPGVYLDYMRLVPVVAAYEGFPEQ